MALGLLSIPIFNLLRCMFVHQTDTEAWNTQHSFRKNTTQLVNHTELKADANESVWKERDKFTWTKYNTQLDQRLSRRECPPTSGRGGICLGTLHHSCNLVVSIVQLRVVTMIRQKSAISELDSDDRHEANHIMKEAEAMSSSTEERKAGISEWRRLKRTL